MNGLCDLPFSTVSILNRGFLSIAKSWLSNGISHQTVNHLHPDTDLIALNGSHILVLIWSFWKSQVWEGERRGVCLEEQDNFLGPKFPSLPCSLPPSQLFTAVCLLPLSPSSSLWLSRAYVSVVCWWTGGSATTVRGGGGVTHVPGPVSQTWGGLDQGLP